MGDKLVLDSYRAAKETYARWGVDTEKAMEALKKIALSIQCWQGDDGSGFENSKGVLTGGIAATGNHPGKARNADELRSDYEAALALIPGSHRVNLHAIYAETGDKKVARDELRGEHFDGWIDWAREKKLGIDFNSTFYSHPLSADGFSLSSRDEAKRQFWVRHGKASRRIGEYIGKKLGKRVITNHWIPDGYKDTPASRLEPRTILLRSLDEMFSESINPSYNVDAVEGKLFGLGSESYVVGSQEFYTGYAITRKKLLCLDMGHFHPTETVSDKISSHFLYLDEILLHVSRGVRWDSDHVVALDDELLALAKELVRGDFLGRTNIGLDFFDASINRVAAWVIGVRSTQKALLSALLEPSAIVREAESAGDLTGRLAMLEDFKLLPVGAVWDFYCETMGVPPGNLWLDSARRYEKEVLFERK